MRKYNDRTSISRPPASTAHPVRPLHGGTAFQPDMFDRTYDSYANGDAASLVDQGEGTARLPTRRKK